MTHEALINEVIEERIKDVIKYLVIRRLSNNIIPILSIKEYYIDDLSPSTIAHKYRISKTMVRGYLLRILDKAETHNLAYVVIKRTFNTIMNLNPIIFKFNHYYYCILCDEKFYSQEHATRHVWFRHRELVDELVDEVFRRCFRDGGSGK